MAIEDRRGPPVGNPDGCPEAEQLAAYAEGGLSAEERRATERHLADCADCRAVLAETIAFVHAEDGVAVPMKEPARSDRPARAQRLPPRDRK